MKEELAYALKEILGQNNENKTFTGEEKLRAAYALNMCMVSVSQIIDYDDLNVLEQEYEGILNNLNLEIMPKDEALLSIIKQLLDTITFFRMQEGDKRIVDDEYQQKMKNAIWSAVPNVGLIIAGKNPVTMATSLASQVGIGYMNYRRAKFENKLNYEKQHWQLQKSAMEQFNGLRRELFDTAWRLADKYNFPDEYRLTERQIKQYNEILMDQDEIRKYERLTTIRNKFYAYPPFWYYYGSTANHIARNECLNLSESSRGQYKKEALNHFDIYWRSNQYALLREDMIASACALEHVDLLDVTIDKEKILQLLSKAVEFSGNAKDILQLCAVAYLRIGKIDEAAELLRILVNEEYNVVVNAQILSGLYVHKVHKNQDIVARTKYETLAVRVNSDYLFRLPATGEVVDETELEYEFEQHQEEILKAKFSAVITYYFNEFSIRLSKLIPVPDISVHYPDFYYSREGLGQRIKDMKELFNSPYKKKQKQEYLDRLARCGFITAYFDELNRFFGEITELNCIRDRQKLEEIVKNQLIECSQSINCLTKKIEEGRIDYKDILQLFDLASVTLYDELIKELQLQISVTLLGMDDMYKYSIADTRLKEFCDDHNIPQPDELITEGIEAKSDTGLITNYFGFELLGEQGEQLQKEQSRYRQIETVIRKYEQTLNTVSGKSCSYFHDSEKFNTYFEKSKLKKHKDILQKTIAVFDDMSLHNVDVLFTVDGVVPVIRNNIKTPIPYMTLAGENEKRKFAEAFKKVSLSDAKITKVFPVGLMPVSGLAGIAMGGAAVADTYAINHILTAVQPMINEICSILLTDINE